MVASISKERQRPGRPGSEVDSLVPSAASGTPDPLDLGLRARNRGAHERALGFFEDAAAETPNKLRPRLEIARTLLALDRVDEARLQCQSLLKMAPDCSPALLMLGLMAFRSDDYSGAVEHFRAAAKLKPLDENAQDKVARSLLKLGCIEEAAAFCRGVLRERPDHAGANMVLAMIVEQHPDRAGTTSDIHGAAALRPDKTELDLKMIHLLHRTGRHTEAEVRCRELLKQQPCFPEATHVLGLILWKRGDLEAGQVQLKSAAEQKPSDPDFQLALARILRSANRPDEARFRFKQVLEISPDNVAAVLGLANIARAMTDLPEALALFQQAARLDPADPVIPLEAAFILSALNRPDEAEDMMELAETLAAVRGNAVYAQRRFENYCHTEQWEKAEKCLAGWPDPRELPEDMIHSVTRYFVERKQWHELLDFFRSRIVEAGWSLDRKAAEDVVDFVAIATRQTARYGEILDLLVSWSGDSTNGLVARLRDQLNEELGLLQAVEAVDGPIGNPAGAISDPLRRERQALRLRVLAPERQRSMRVPDSPIVSPSGQQLHNTIFYCTDADYLLAAATSIFSLLRHNNAVLPHCRIVVWCSTDVLAFASEVLGAVAQHFGRQIEVLPSSALFSGGLQFRTKFGVFTGRLLSEAAYYRIFAASQLIGESGGGRALYIDSDTCCAGGIDRLLSFDMKGLPLAARREPPDSPGIVNCVKKLGLEPGVYFNSGVLLFDLAHPALQPALERSVGVSLQQQQILTHLDQCALNLGFQDQVTSLDTEFNHALRDDGEEVLPDAAPTIVHFLAAPKPWDPRYRNRQCMLWFAEFEALAEALTPTTLKRLAASFIPRARTVHGICADVSTEARPG